MGAKVFIGCSRESKDIAERLELCLNSNGFQTLPWFYRDKFKSPGNVTLWTNLIRIASTEVQKAVFIFAPDDVVARTPTDRRLDTSRFDTSAESHRTATFLSMGDLAALPDIHGVFKPRDNVLMEYGLFVGKLGMENVVILVRPGTTLPSDLQSMSHRTFDEVVRTLREGSSSVTSKRTYSRLLFNPPLVMGLCRSLTDVEQVGRSRYLYSTRMGANAWRAMEKGDDHSESVQAPQLNESMKKFLASAANKHGGSISPLSTPVLQVVSYGPGVGILDKSFLTSALPNRRIDYVPVDISVPLLSMTIETMKSARGLIEIPFAVHGDFEDGIDEIMSMLRAELGRQPRMHLMLGGTFANIEKSEDVFLKTLGQELGKEDLFLLDVFSKQTSYDEKLDPFRTPLHLGAKQRMFLAVGVAKVLGRSIPDSPKSEDIDTLLQEIEVVVDKSGGASSVPDTTTIRYHIRGFPGNFFSFRRYNSKRLIRYLRDSVGFEVIHKESFPRPLAGLARTVLVLRGQVGGGG